MENNLLFSLAPWAVLLPVFGLLLNLVFGKRLGEKGIGLIASLATGLAFLVSVLLAIALSRHPEATVVPLADWITVGQLNLAWAFRVDTLSVTMMLAVTGVGTLIHVYATGYMHKDVRHQGDPGSYRRFFVYFNLFIVAMLLLVSANNYLMLFVGWEGVGLCSYLLIGFWFNKGAEGIGNARAAKKAFVVNRIGDFGLLIAIFLLFWNFGTLEFDGIFAAAAKAAPALVLVITLFMLLGVTGKSAQLPLYVWLPDAMAGPTPVSALIHAATMVTAGVYLIARSSPLYIQVPAAQMTVAWVGALTALFAATIAVGQYDIKKVLAYSTISQLGFMVAAVGMGAYVAGMFHLVTHAFFKALLFLAAGSVIMGMEHGEEQSAHGRAPGDAHSLDPQDMRNMGGLQGRMRTTFWVYLAGALALSGIAPLSGFFSKDEILAAAFRNMPVLFILLLAAAFLTAFYMGRQIFMVFFGKARSAAAEQAHESPPVITVPLIILAVLSVVGGALNLPGVHSLGHWLEGSLAHTPTVEFIAGVALLSLAVALAGLFLAWMVYGQRRMPFKDTDPLARSLGGLFTAVYNKWWVDELYQAVILRPYQQLSDLLARTVDMGWIDGTVNGLGSAARSFAGQLRRLENGYVRSYALTIFLGVVAIMAYLFFR
ncbi:MAG: NADH-quinone oxidoreductase subunit L [Anaerolineaceae bacterium]|nr:NADH-quinone oxidoreductase subunit L [Anaerolineaceae bacterium]